MKKASFKRGGSNFQKVEGGGTRSREYLITRESDKGDNRRNRGHPDRDQQNNEKKGGKEPSSRMGGRIENGESAGKAFHDLGRGPCTDSRLRPMTVL